MSDPEIGTVTFDLPTTQRVKAIHLKVTGGPDDGRTAEVDRAAFIVGVGQNADLRLTDPKVSREHLRISPVENGVRIKDDGSKNGTYIGPARVFDLLLTSSASITIGNTTLFVEILAKTVDVPLSARDSFGSVIGRSPPMRGLFAKMEQVAPSELTVLIEGESGVGKDILARAIHAASPRASGPFVVADCGSIPEGLIESELFGHARGAFTGADTARQGLFEEANGGTIFLDEIGELGLAMQPKLLRVLEAREVRPVGGRAPVPIDVRVISATNRKLAEAARTGEFRSDLFYRLAVVRVQVPPLRDRRDDILPIARSMLRSHTKNPMADFAPAFAAMLATYDWPGNARELRNVVERYAALGADAGPVFEPAAKIVEEEEDIFLLPYQEARRHVLDKFDDVYVKKVLDRADGVVARAAELAGIGRASLYRMLERLRMIQRDGS